MSGAEKPLGAIRAAGGASTLEGGSEGSEARRVIDGLADEVFSRPLDLGEPYDDRPEPRSFAEALGEDPRRRHGVVEAISWDGSVGPITFSDRAVGAAARADLDWRSRVREIEGSWTRPRYEDRRVVKSDPGSWRSADGSPYGLKVLERAVREIRALEKGGRNAEIARIAYTVGGFVGGGHIDKAHALHEVEEAAREVGGRDWPQMVETARRTLTAGESAPLGPTEDAGESGTTAIKRSPRRRVGAPRKVRGIG